MSNFRDCLARFVDASIDSGVSPADAESALRGQIARLEERAGEGDNFRPAAISAHAMMIAAAESRWQAHLGVRREHGGYTVHRTNGGFEKASGRTLSEAIEKWGRLHAVA